VVIESVLGTAARLLVRQNHNKAAHLLANGGGRVRLYDDSNSDYDVWQFLLAIPAEVYFDIPDRPNIEQQINDALTTAMEPLRDIIIVKISTELERDSDWRAKVNRHVSGVGITNQGRVRSDNIATLEYDGLLFRSRLEVMFYNALKSSGVPFAPLSVVLNGGVPTRQRVEPDFVLYKAGLVMIVEIDSNLYHRETPAMAHNRLKFLTDEGVLLERIDAAACDTPDKAREAVGRVLETLRKHRQAR
jgi:hypothetical protein